LSQAPSVATLPSALFVERLSLGASGVLGEESAVLRELLCDQLNKGHKKIRNWMTVELAGSQESRRIVEVPR